MLDLAELFRTGPDTLGGRYMRTFWNPIYVAQDLQRGWAKPIRIMGEDFTLYRGESGTPHLVAFRYSGPPRSVIRAKERTLDSFRCRSGSL